MTKAELGDHIAVLAGISARLQDVETISYEMGKGMADLLNDFIEDLTTLLGDEPILLDDRDRLRHLEVRMDAAERGER